jgi:hypothetical protein
VVVGTVVGAPWFTSDSVVVVVFGIRPTGVGSMVEQPAATIPIKTEAKRLKFRSLA